MAKKDLKSKDPGEALAASGAKWRLRCRRVLKRLQRLEVSSGGVATELFVLPLRAGEAISLTGTVDVRLARGTAELWGARLGAAPQFCRVAAPVWSARPQVRALRSSNSTTDSAEACEEVHKFLSDHTRWPVVLVLRRCTRARSVSGAVEVDSVLQLETFRANLAEAAASPRLQAHQAWPCVVEHFARFAACSETSGTLLVTGAKGVGKSTCCRYLVNALLSEFSEVCYLEIDVGQPELNAPGMVALHKVRKPLFLPAHGEQHEHETLASFFAGGTTPAVNPTMYLSCVRSAAEEYAMLPPKRPPLVVNTLGWVTGLGAELLHIVLRVVRPHLVLRICSSAPDTESSPGVSETSSQGPSALARCSPLRLELAAAAGLQDPTVAQDEAGCVIMSLASGAKAQGLVDRAEAATTDGQHEAPKQSERTVKGLKAMDLRWLRFASYFKGNSDLCQAPQGTPTHMFLKDVPRSRLSFEKLKFIALNRHEPLDLSEIPAAFTGTLVALCDCNNVAMEVHTAPASPFTTIFPCDSLAPRCLTLAFVHAFDLRRGELVVHVPARALPLLDSVNAVVRGDVSWEPDGPQGESFLAHPLEPFHAAWSLEGLGSGARVLSTRRNVLRKRGREKSSGQM